MDAFFQPLAVLTEQPWLAAIPGVLFLWLGTGTRRRVILGTGVAWLFYLAYEYGMRWRILCTGECNIRVDLLLLYPALLVVSILAVASALRAIGRARG